MPARMSPTTQDAATARQILLDGLAHGVMWARSSTGWRPCTRGTTPSRARSSSTWPPTPSTRPGSTADPIDLAGIRERFMPEYSITGRDRRKLQFAVLAAAAQHGGVDVDLLDEVTWWQPDDFWRYAAYAAVASIRMAADRAGVPVPEACRGIASTQSP